MPEKSSWSVRWLFGEWLKIQGARRRCSSNNHATDYQISKQPIPRNLRLTINEDDSQNFENNEVNSMCILREDRWPRGGDVRGEAFLHNVIFDALHLELFNVG